MDALREEQDYIVSKYNVEAPSNPRLDLPFSFLLDTVIFFPVALPIAAGVALLE